MKDWNEWMARAEAAEAELRARELHHFETEQENAALRAKVKRVERLPDDWSDLVKFLDGVGEHQAASHVRDCSDALRAALTGPVPAPEQTNLREELRKAAELNRQRLDWTKRGMPTLRRLAGDPEAQAAGEDES